MRRVVLTKDVIDGTGIKVCYRPGRPAVVFTTGTVVEMSDASARKYVDRGWAIPEPDPEPEEAEVDG